MNRRALALAALLLVTGGGWGCRSGKAPSAAGCHLLLITLDTTRADALGAYGDSAAQTPHLDEMARAGILFDDCRSAVPLTLPAHGTLFTGRYPFQHGVRDNGGFALPPSATTLAEVLRRRGYRTAAVVAAFVLLGKFGLNQGFDAYDDSLDSHVMYNNFSSEIRGDRVVAKFRRWLDGYSGGPFFAWVHFYDPHLPYNAPRPWSDRFATDKRGAYRAEVSFMDESVGRVMAALREKGLLDDTLVVIAGDHGEGFGEHAEEGHGVFGYDETLRVPLLLYNRRLFPAGRRVAAPVGLVDVMPTLCELFAAEAPAGMAGRSLVPLLAGRAEAAPRDLYFESLYGREQFGWAPLTGIVSGSHKYVSLPEPELYDLRGDAGESRNLFRQQGRLARDLDARLARLLAEAGNPGAAGDSRRALSAQDLRRLQSLGYVSSFSAHGRAGADPKRGIVVHNRLKELFAAASRDPDAAERDLLAFAGEHPEVREMSAFFDLRQRICVQRNQPLQALEVSRQAVRKFPRDEAMFISYALQLSALGRAAEAEATCRRLLEQNSRFTRAYMLLGEIAEQRQRLDEASSWYEQALRLEPENISLRLKSAELLVRRRDFARALPLYDALLERPEIAADAGLVYKIGLFHLRFGDPARAEALLRRAVELEPGGGHYYFYALALGRNGKTAAALQAMETATSRFFAALDPQQRQTAARAIDVWRRGK